MDLLKDLKQAKFLSISAKQGSDTYRIIVTGCKHFLTEWNYSPEIKIMERITDSSKCS